MEKILNCVKKVIESNGKIDALNGKIDALSGKIDALNEKIIVSEEYAKKLITLLGIIAKIDSQIEKNNYELEENQVEKRSILKRRKDNKAKLSKLDNKQEKNSKRFYRITIGLLVIAIPLMVVSMIWSWLSWYLLVITLLSCSNVVFYYNIKSKINREIANIKAEMNQDKTLESDLDEKIAKIRRIIDKLERTNLIAKVEADSVIEAFDQLAEQINVEQEEVIVEQEEVNNELEKVNVELEQCGLQKPQMVAPNQFSLSSQDNSPKQVIASNRAAKAQPNKNKDYKVSLW